MDDAENIYHQTGSPLLPCMIFHVCIPCSPCCVMVYCDNRRSEKLRDLVKKFNAENLEKGIYLVLNTLPRPSFNEEGNIVYPQAYRPPGLDVKMNIPKTKQYCTQSGIDFEMVYFVGAPNTRQPHRVSRRRRRSTQQSPSMVNPYVPPPPYPEPSAPPSDEFGASSTQQHPFMVNPNDPPPPYPGPPVSSNQLTSNFEK